MIDFTRALLTATARRDIREAEQAQYVADANRDVERVREFHEDQKIKADEVRAILGGEVDGAPDAFLADMADEARVMPVHRMRRAIFAGPIYTPNRATRLEERLRER